MRLTRTAALAALAAFVLPGRCRRPDRAGLEAHARLRRRAAARLRAGRHLRGAGGAAAHHRRSVARRAGRARPRATSSPSTPGATTASRWARSSSSRRLQKDRDQIVSRDDAGHDAAPPAGSASTPWTTRCRWPPSSRLRPGSSRRLSRAVRAADGGAARREDGQAGEAATTPACCLATIAARPSAPASSSSSIAAATTASCRARSSSSTTTSSEAGNFLYEVADAVAVDVRESSSTLQLTFARTAVSVNDYVSMRK